MQVMTGGADGVESKRSAFAEEKNLCASNAILSLFSRTECRKSSDRVNY